MKKRLKILFFVLLILPFIILAFPFYPYHPFFANGMLKVKLMLSLIIIIYSVYVFIVNKHIIPVTAVQKFLFVFLVVVFCYILFILTYLT